MQQICSMLLVFALLAFAAVAASTPRAAAEECRRPPQPELRFRAVRQAVGQGPDISLRELQRVVGDATAAIHPLLGVSASKAAFDLQVTSATEDTADGRVCAYAVTVDVKLGVIDRLFRVVAETRADACLVALAIEHHQRHFAADDQALDVVAPVVADRIGAELVTLGKVTGDSAASAEAALKASIERLVRAASSLLHVAMEEAGGTVDIAEALAELRGACGGRARSMLLTPL